MRGWVVECRRVGGVRGEDERVGGGGWESGWSERRGCKRVRGVVRGWRNSVGTCLCYCPPRRHRLHRFHLHADCCPNAQNLLEEVDITCIACREGVLVDITCIACREGCIMLCSNAV
jgi:hypothetical protein